MSNSLASSAQINEKIEQMASDILRDHAQSAPLFVALLRGAAPFASKLMFALTRQAPDFHPELDYMMVSTYGDGRQAGTPRIVTDLAPSTEVNDRTVIVLDDVLDRGITAHFVSEYLLSKGARNVQLAVLAAKSVEREHDITPDYCCFDDVGEKWLCGMGMDDVRTVREAYRWLEEIREVST